VSHRNAIFLDPPYHFCLPTPVLSLVVIIKKKKNDSSLLPVSGVGKLPVNRFAISLSLNRMATERPERLFLQPLEWERGACGPQKPRDIVGIQSTKPCVFTKMYELRIE
jgi:hypothetical protein